MQGAYTAPTTFIKRSTKSGQAMADQPDQLLYTALELYDHKY
jgi:hypothetical protein